MLLIGRCVVMRHQEEAASPVGSDKVAEEEGEDLDDEEYDEEEEEDDDDRPRKKPRHGGFILDEAGASRPAPAFLLLCLRGALTRLCAFSFLCVSSLSRCGRRV